MLSRFPQLLSVTAEGDIPPEQELLVVAHSLLDDGRDYCAACASVVEAAPFCSECGAALYERPKARDCPHEGCGYRGPARYCPRDGTRIISPIADAVSRGETTWDAAIDRAWSRASARLDAADERQKQRRAVAAMGSP